MLPMFDLAHLKVGQTHYHPHIHSQRVCKQRNVKCVCVHTCECMWVCAFECVFVHVGAGVVYVLVCGCTSVYVDVCVVYVHKLVHRCAHASVHVLSQGRSSSALIHHSPPYSLDRGSLSELRARLGDQQSYLPQPGISCFLPSQHRVTGAHRQAAFGWKCQLRPSWLYN